MCDHLAGFCVNLASAYDALPALLRLSRMARVQPPIHMFEEVLILEDIPVELSEINPG